MKKQGSPCTTPQAALHIHTAVELTGKGKPFCGHCVPGNCCAVQTDCFKNWKNSYRLIVLATLPCLFHKGKVFLL